MGNDYDVAMDLIDYYIDHYTELGHKDTARKFKELKEDVENAIAFQKKIKKGEAVNVEDLKKLPQRSISEDFKKFRESQEPDPRIRLIKRLDDKNEPITKDEYSEEYKRLIEEAEPFDIFEHWVIKPTFDKAVNAVYQRGKLSGTSYIDDGIWAEFVFLGEPQEGYVSKQGIVENAIAFKEE